MAIDLADSSRWTNFEDLLPAVEVAGGGSCHMTWMCRLAVVGYHENHNILDSLIVGRV